MCIRDRTLAAEVVAGELGLDLLVVDLSQVVNKYVGETEKNLARVFEAAEDSGAVLLFDEADALFGKRTEVRDSHDRYANLEVGYLLQRVESFRGLAILTTNARNALDSAFLRRLRVIVPVQLTGEAKGVKVQGGTLDFVHREVALECLPADIPEHIVVDVTELMISQGVRVRDLPADGKWTAVSEPEMLIVHIVAPRAEAVATPDAAATPVAAAEPEVMKKGKPEKDKDEKDKK